MSKLWETLLRPAMFSLDAERAHEIGVTALRRGLAKPFASDYSDERLAVERFGIKFPNPLGIAAGFDKNGIVVNQLASLGLGFVEVGTVTLEPQKGNPKPRVFRLTEDRALINRLGFNNDGAAVVAERLLRLKRKCVVGVNIGRNHDVANEDAVENYLAAFDAVCEVADYIAVNISSPNTPNLRELQSEENLDALLGALQDRNRASGGNASENERADWVAESTLVHTRVSARKPLLVKIAPDVIYSDLELIVETCMRHTIAGVIATNTTISRDGLKSREVASIGAGGLSGQPLANRSTEVIRQIYRVSKGKLPIIGVGGIFSAEDAFEKIAAGASLVQAYTGFVYGGPTFAKDVNEGLARLMAERGVSSIDLLVGTET